MSFMQQQIEQGFAYVIETDYWGSFVVPSDVCGVIDGLEAVGDYMDDDEVTNEFIHACNALHDYVDGKIVSIELAEGYLARMSAPGYTDCTDWSLYETEAEARDALTDMYGDYGDDE